MEAKDPVFILLKGPSLPPASEAKAMLGRIVKNFAQPLSDYEPEDASAYSKLKPNVTPLTNAARIVTATASSALKGRFLSIADALLSKGTSRASFLENSKISSWELRRQETVFQQLIKDPAVLEQVKAWAKPKEDPAYMIVGLLIWEDASMAAVKAQGTSSDAALKLPTGAAASSVVQSTTGVTISPELVGDIEAERENKVESVMFHGAQSNDSRIFAVQFRNIRGRSSGFLKKQTGVALEDYGPRVDEERMYGDDDAFLVLKEDAELLLDERDAIWTNVLEEISDPVDLAQETYFAEVEDEDIVKNRFFLVCEEDAD